MSDDQLDALDWRVGRLEERVDDGFDNVNSYLGRIDKRLSEHEHNHHGMKTVLRPGAIGGGIVAVLSGVVQVLMRVFGV